MTHGTGLFGRSISFHWNITTTNLPQPSITVRNNTIANGTGITDYGRKIFRARISQIWLKDNTLYHYGLSIRNLTYDDTNRFHLTVKYLKNGAVVNAGHSIISIKVIGEDFKKCFQQIC